MSYATYLRNKAASQPKITSLHKPTDASQHTTKKRFEASQTFFVDGSFGSLGTPVASTFAAYRGGQGIGNDSKYLGGGKVTTQTCCQVQAPDSTKYRSASEITREKMACDKSNALLDPPKFVDNTIRLSAMHPEMVAEECCNHQMVQANHTHSEGIHPQVRPTQAITQHTFMAAPPNFQNQGVGGSRIGAYYTPKSGYVENKHGNDLGVNPRRVPTMWRFSRGAPAHLKINDPKFGNVKP